MDFASILLQWYDKNKRDLPWRQTTDPYRIWLSEIILQQTRIQQGLSYYQKFTEQWPDVNSLANATEDQVLAKWQGLGYYSRARNLHQTAKEVVNNHNSTFPESFYQLLKLKGIGKYTAAAIASIAFGLPVPAIDGNVTRVMARFLGIEDPVDNFRTIKIIEQAATELIDNQRPGDYNQAMMDFGSMICKPAKPDCGICPLSNFCYALKAGKTSKIPVKEKKIIQATRYFHFFFFYSHGFKVLKFLAEKRTGNDIWKNLYQLPLLETFNEQPGTPFQTDSFIAKESDSNSNYLFAALQQLIRQGYDPNLWFSKIYLHQLTHRTIKAKFYSVIIPEELLDELSGKYLKVTLSEFETKGKPVLITKYLNWVVKHLIGNKP